MRKSLARVAIGLAAVASISAPAEAQRSWHRSGRAAAHQIDRHSTPERAKDACAGDETVWVNSTGYYYRKGQYGYGQGMDGSYVCLAGAKRMNLRAHNF